MPVANTPIRQSRTSRSSAHVTAAVGTNSIFLCCATCSINLPSTSIAIDRLSRIYPPLEGCRLALNNAPTNTAIHGLNQTKHTRIPHTPSVGWNYQGTGQAAPEQTETRRDMNAAENNQISASEYPGVYIFDKNKRRTPAGRTWVVEKQKRLETKHIYIHTRN